MADINFLGGSSQPKDDKKPVQKAGPDEVRMHMPAPEAPVPKPPAPPASLSGLKALFPTPQPQAASPKPQVPAGLFSSKVATGKLAEPVLPKMNVPPPPKPPAPPAPPKPPAPPPPPKPPMPPPKKPEPAKDTAGTMRVSLIPTSDGAGLSDLAVRERMRTFILVMVFALVVDALIYGGILWYKSRIGQETAQVEADIKVLDGRIAEAEKRTAPAKDLQDFLKSAEQALKAHQHWTNLLAMLQSLTKPEVQYLNLTGSEEGSFVVDVRTKDYTTLARQIVALSSDARIKGVGFSGATFDDAAGTSANFMITFDPSVLKYQASKDVKK